jgi:hypothetical protein
VIDYRRAPPDPFGLSSANSKVNYGPSWCKDHFPDCQPSLPRRQRFPSFALSVEITCRLERPPPQNLAV